VRNDCTVGKLSERNEADNEEVIRRWSGVAQPRPELHVRDGVGVVQPRPELLLRDGVGVGNGRSPYITPPLGSDDPARRS